MFKVRGRALARPLSNDPDMWVFEWLNVTKAPKRFSGGAGMASTASDYARLLQMLVNGGTLDGARLLSPMTVRWALARPDRHHARCRASGGRLFLEPGQPGPGERRRRAFPGNVGDLFWGGITGPRYFVDPKEKLVGIVFVQGPSIRAAYHAELRSMVYGAMNSSKEKVALEPRQGRNGFHRPATQEIRKECKTPAARPGLSFEQMVRMAGTAQ